MNPIGLCFKDTVYRVGFGLFECNIYNLRHGDGGAWMGACTKLGWFYGGFIFFFQRGNLLLRPSGKNFAGRQGLSESTSVPEAFVWLCSSSGAFVRHAELGSANLNALRGLGVRLFLAIVSDW
jgi:hypothetical protein